MDSAPLIALFALIVALLIGRAVTRERNEFARFRRLRSTVARQKVYRRWLIESLVVMGGLSAVTLFASASWLSAVLVEAQELPGIGELRDWFGTDVGSGIATGLAVGAVLGFVLPVILLRRTPIEEIPTVGNIRALLPRTRGELPYGLGLALSAGIFEELLFRLALPALLFGITGDALLSFAVSSILFGLLHLYQGPTGIAAASALGVGFALLYVVSGSIALPILVHALIDLRSLVLIPVVLGSAWKPRPTPAPVTPPASPEPPPAPASE